MIALIILLTSINNTQIRAENELAKTSQIYLIKHAWHTGIIIATEDLHELSFLPPHFSKLKNSEWAAEDSVAQTETDLTQSFNSAPTLAEQAQQAQENKGIEYFEFAWGDARFYQTEVITIYNTLRALFWPTDSVLHVVALNQHPTTFFPNSDVIEIPISREGIIQLSQMMRESFLFAVDDEPSVLKKGLYGESYFFESNQIYSLFNTCNKWSAHHLAAAGIPMTPALTFTAEDVMEQARTALEQLR